MSCFSSHSKLIPVLRVHSFSKYLQSPFHMSGTSVNKNRNFKKTKIPAQRVSVSSSIFCRLAFELNRRVTEQTCLGELCAPWPSSLYSRVPSLPSKGSRPNWPQSAETGAKNKWTEWGLAPSRPFSLPRSALLQVKQLWEHSRCLRSWGSKLTTPVLQLRAGLPRC